MEEMDISYSTDMLQEQLGICPGELSDPPGTSYALAPSPVELIDYVGGVVETERDFPNNYNNHMVAAHEDVTCISPCQDMLHTDSYSGMGYTPTPSVTSRATGDTDSGSEADDAELSYDLQKGSGILKEIMKQAHKSITWPFRNAVDADALGCGDYYKIVEKPIWLRKMREKFDTRQYETITEFVADFRLMLENCYRFNGPDHSISKKAQKLETILEQKLALLSRDMRDKTSIAATTGNPSTERIISGTRRRKVIVPHDSTALLNQLRMEEKEREKEQKRHQIEEKKRLQEDFIASLQEWEDQLLGEPHGEQMKAMWELAQIGHFFFLCREPLNIGEVPQYEVERCLLMPRESSMLQRIMTTLLSTPYQRTKLDKKPFMPYKVWEDKLRHKLRYWFRMFKESGRNTLKLAMKLGIEENFFNVVGHKNPLEKRKFHEISFYQRVWIVKSLCDYCMEQHEALRESCELQDVLEQREYPLGTDASGNIFLHFPQFCGPDLRIYRQSPLPVPKMEKRESIEGKEEYLELVRSSRNKKPKRGGTRSRRKPVIREKPRPPRDSRLRQKPKQLVQATSDNSDDETLESSAIDSSGDESTKRAKLSPRKSPRGRRATPRKSSPASSRDSTPSTVVRRSLRKIIEESKQLTKGLDLPSSRSASPSGSDGTSTPISNCRVYRVGDRMSPNNVDPNAETDVEEDLSQDVPVTSSYSCDENGFVNRNEACSPRMSADGDGADVKVEAAVAGDVETAVQDEEGGVKEEDDNVREGDRDVKEEVASVKEGEDCLIEEADVKEENDNVEEGERDVKKGDDCLKEETDVKEKAPDVKEEAANVKEEAVIQQEHVHVKEENCDATNEDVKEEHDVEADGTVKEEVNNISEQAICMKIKTDGDDSEHAANIEVKMEEELSIKKENDNCSVKSEDVKKEDENKEESSGDEWEEKFPEIGSFELVANSVEQLRGLIVMFSEPESATSGSKRSRSVAKVETRKRCEKELHERLESLLKELEPWEQKLIAINRKAKIKMRKEHEMFVEEVLEKEVRDVWASEESASEESEASDDESTVSQATDAADAPKTPKKKAPKPVESTPVYAENLTEEMGFSARGRRRKRRIIPNNAEDQSLKKRKPIVKEEPTVVKPEEEEEGVVQGEESPPSTSTQSWMPNRFTLDELKEGQQAGLYSIGMVNGQPVLIKAPVAKNKPASTSKAAVPNSDKKFPVYRFTAPPGSQTSTANFQNALKTLLSHAKPVRTPVPPATASTSESSAPFEAVSTSPVKPNVLIPSSPKKTASVTSTVSATNVFSVSGGVGVNNISQLPPAVIQQLVKQQEGKSPGASSDLKIPLVLSPKKPKYAANVTVKELLQKGQEKPATSPPGVVVLPTSHTVQQQQKQIQDQLIRKELQRRITHLEEKHETALQQLTASGSLGTAEAQAVISEHQAVIQKLKDELQSRVTILVPFESKPKVDPVINKKQTIDQALKAVMTTVNTSLPTAQIKVVGASPLQMPCQRPHRPVTMTTTATKGSIPVVPPLFRDQIIKAPLSVSAAASLMNSSTQPTITIQQRPVPQQLNVQRSSAIQPAVQHSLVAQPNAAIQPVTQQTIGLQPTVAIQPVTQQSLAIQPTAAFKPATQQGLAIQPTAALQPATQQSLAIQPGAAIQPVAQPSPSKTLELKITPRTFMTSEGPVQGVVLPPGVILPPKVLLQLTSSKDVGGQGLVVMQQGKDGTISRIAVDSAPKPSPAVVFSEAPKPQAPSVTPQKLIAAPSTSVNPIKTTQEKLMLYQVNGQLVTSQGIPVSISQGQVMLSSSIATARPAVPQVKLISKSNAMQVQSPSMTVLPKTNVLQQPANMQVQAAPVQLQNLALLQPMASGQSFIQVQQQPQLLQLKSQAVAQPQLMQVRSSLPTNAKLQLQPMQVRAHPQLQQLKTQQLQAVQVNAQPQLQTVQIKGQPQLQAVQVNSVPQAQLQILQQQGQQLKILQPQATASRQ